MSGQHWFKTGVTNVGPRVTWLAPPPAPPRLPKVPTLCVQCKCDVKIKLFNNNNNYSTVPVVFESVPFSRLSSELSFIITLFCVKQTALFYYESVK